ncbi:MAG: transcription antitermination factor NusB [Oscillospiraceae bacterium]|nr:transcription antitermination factor NusB [Oscillospiraceae bacterium]MDY4586292.1 transcription antitermination factor NusB [Oscillospiraceae bacterium]
MTRHKSRENAFIAVFEAGFSANDLEDILAVTQELPEYEDYMLDEFAMNLIKLYYDHADEVNDMIQSKLKGWDQKRISRVCSAILRLSTAEMMYSNEDMDSIIINEAVEICKEYAGENDYQFVNGVLGAISKELRNK